MKQKEIADTIGKDKSVISKEIKRNCDKRNGRYNPDLAHRKYINRLKNKPKKKSFDEKVKQYVIYWLKNDYSPEQIVGRAKLKGENYVSHETIYRIIWEDKKNSGTLYEHLRRKGRRYRKRGKLKNNKGIIKDRVDISIRPKIVDKKSRLF